MAFPLPQSSKAPQGTTVAFYQPTRLGKYTKVEIGYAETVRVLEGPYRVIQADDPDGDGSRQVLTLEFFTASTAPLSERVKKLESFVGGEVQRHDRSVIGLVTAVNTVEGTVSLTPGPGNTEDFTGKYIWIGPLNTSGLAPQEVGDDGREWTIVLDTENPVHANLVNQLLGAAYIDAVLAVIADCAENGVTGIPTPADVQASVIRLGAKGVHLDAHIAFRAETVEKLRRAGDIQVEVLGDNP